MERRGDVYSNADYVMQLLKGGGRERKELATQKSRRVSRKQTNIHIANSAE